MHLLETMLTTVAGIVMVIGVLSTISYLVVFGRRAPPVSKRFTDREARRSAAEDHDRRSETR